MDAVEYLKTQYRLCRSQDCTECPLQDKEKCCCIMDTIEYAEKAVQIVEQWAKDNPVKTRQSEFLKMFPNAEVGYDGILNINPCRLEPSVRESMECSIKNCRKCRREYWLAEVTDNE